MILSICYPYNLITLHLSPSTPSPHTTVNQTSPTKPSSHEILPSSFITERVQWRGRRGGRRVLGEPPAEVGGCAFNLADVNNTHTHTHTSATEQEETCYWGHWEPNISVWNWRWPVARLIPPVPVQANWWWIWIFMMCSSMNFFLQPNCGCGSCDSEVKFLFLNCSWLYVTIHSLPLLQGGLYLQT